MINPTGSNSHVMSLYIPKSSISHAALYTPKTMDFTLSVNLIEQLYLKIAFTQFTRVHTHVRYTHAVHITSSFHFHKLFISSFHSIIYHHHANFSYKLQKNMIIQIKNTHASSQVFSFSSPVLTAQKTRFLTFNPSSVTRFALAFFLQHDCLIYDGM